MNDGMGTPAADAILTVENLAIEFPVAGGALRAVDGLSFTLEAGKTTAIVGESGSGKSISALSILRLTDTLRARIKIGRASCRERV